MNVDLHIDQLILHGFDPADRDRMAKALERELVRLLAEQGVPPALVQRGQVGAIESGEFEVAPEADADAIGTQVARKIYGVL
jgi:hypothetical protein